MFFIPKDRVGRQAAVVILGPLGFVKEQSPTQYAARLAAPDVAKWFHSHLNAAA